MRGDFSKSYFGGIHSIYETHLGQAQSPETVRELDFLLEFNDCSRTSSIEVECSFLIQNERSNRRRIRINAMTLFDASGQAVRASSRVFPGQNSYVMYLPPGVPVKGSGVFDGIPADTSVVFLEVEIYAYPPDFETFSAGFEL